MGHIFISYSRHDSGFVGDLTRDLKARGLQCWVDVSDIGGGQRWREETAAAIQNCDAFLIVISEHSVVSNDVENELALAEASGRRLLPILYRPVNPPNWMRYSLGRMQWINFAEQTYESAFVYLMQAFAPGEPPQSTEPKYLSWISLAYVVGALYLFASFGTCLAQAWRSGQADCLQSLGISYGGLIAMNTLLGLTLLCGAVLFLRWQLAAPVLIVQWIATAVMGIWAMQHTLYGKGFLIALLITAPTTVYVFKLHRHERLVSRQAEQRKQV